VPRNRGCSLNQALKDGEDYELLFAVSERTGKRIESRWSAQFSRVPLTRIGEFRRERTDDIGSGGWDHFEGQ
jgi:thiamine-monophosphate kinase